MVGVAQWQIHPSLEFGKVMGYGPPPSHPPRSHENCLIPQTQGLCSKFESLTKYTTLDVPPVLSKPQREKIPQRIQA